MPAAHYEGRNSGQSENIDLYRERENQFDVFHCLVNMKNWMSIHWNFLQAMNKTLPLVELDKFLPGCMSKIAVLMTVLAE